MSPERAFEIALAAYDKQTPMMQFLWTRSKAGSMAGAVAK
jgi:hypothetical protein